jgi:hypothetical protein
MGFSQDRLEKISSLFHLSLFDGNDGEAARSYVQDAPPNGRGIDIESLRGYEVGYCPTDVLYPHAVRTSSQGHLWYMRGRLVLTLRDLYGRILGFSGRMIPTVADDLWISLNRQFGDQKATELHKRWMDRKWVNESYTKGHHVFRLHETVDDILSSGAAVIVEGTMDTILMHAAGITNCVSILGTQITGIQLALLKRFTDHLVFCFDADQAGIWIRDKLSETVASGLDMGWTTIVLPPKMDPEDVLGSPREREMLIWAARDASTKRIPGRTIDLSREDHRSAIAWHLEKREKTT